MNAEDAEIDDHRGDALERALRDLIEHGAAVERLVSRGKAAYDSDEMLRLAAESLLIRAGEAVSRVESASPTFVCEHPELELRQLNDARNVVAHGYDIVDAELVWTILDVHVPRVVERVASLLCQ